MPDTGFSPQLWKIKIICRAYLTILKIVLQPPGIHLMVSILYIDDERDLLELGKIFLEQSPDFTVDTRSSAKEALALPRLDSYDVIISDYMMPDMDGIGFLKAVRSISPAQPFILFTGRGREDIVIEAINNGADFYLQKGGDTEAQFAELTHKVRQVVARRDAERALIESEKRLREAQEMAHLGFWIWDVKTGTVEWSPEVFRIFGLDPTTFTPRIDSILALSPWPGDNTRDKELIRRASISRQKGSYEQRFLRPDKSIGYYQSTFEGRFDAEGNLEQIVGTVLDITERKRAEDALRESEERFRQLITAAPIPFSVADYEGRIEFINTQFTRIFGYTLDEIPTIYAWFDRACPDDNSRKRAYQLWKTNVRDAERRGTLMDPVEYPVTCRDGTVRHVIINSIAVKGKILAAFIDLTERKAAESALQKNREQYQSLVEQANSIILRWGSDGKITFANVFAQRFFGYTAEELIGKSLVGTIVPTTESGSNRDLSRMMEEIIRDPVQYVLNENENVKKDGTRIWVQWHNTPLLDDKGRFTGMFSIGFDITERQNREKTLKSAYEDLERKVQEYSDTGYRKYDNGKYQDFSDEGNTG